METVGGRFFRTVGFLPVFLWLTVFGWPCFAQNAQEQAAILEKVVRQLARPGKGLAIYTYLEQHSGQFAQAAKNAGLAELLDGAIDWNQFSQRWAQQSTGQTNTQPKPELDLQFEAFERSMRVYPVSPSGPIRVVQQYAAGNLSLEQLTESIRAEMWEASVHRFRPIWTDSRLGTVAIHEVPGEVVWFNPNVSIPELGIRAGQPLTPEQQKALVRLFGVEIGPSPSQAQAQGNAGSAPRQGGGGLRIFGLRIGTASPPQRGDGTASFIRSHMGRAIGADPFAVTILNDRGLVMPDVVIKGVGSTSSNSGGFNLDLNEAIIDAEYSRAIYRAGVDNYDSLLVIRPTGSQGNGLYVRTPRSMMRHEDMDVLSQSPNVLRQTLERHLQDLAAMEGRDQPMSIKEWAEDFLPTRTGRNAGLLDALGIQHPSSSLRSNHGLAETVDWGGVTLGQPGQVNDQNTHWRQVQATIQSVDRILPDTGKVDVSAAKTAYDAGFSEGVNLAAQGQLRVQLREEPLRLVNAYSVRRLAGVYGSNIPSNANIDQMLQELRRQGVLEPQASSGARTQGLALAGSLSKRPSAVDQATRFARSYGNSFGLFGAGYLLSEAFRTVEDSVRAGRPVADRWTQMAHPAFALDFAKTFGAFTAGAAAAHHGLRASAGVLQTLPVGGLRPVGAFLSRAPVLGGAGLALGMALAQWVSTGEPPNPARLAVSVGSFMLTNLVTRRVLTLALGQAAKMAFRGAALGALGPVGWGILALDLGLTLYFGQSLEELVWHGLTSLFGGGKGFSGGIKSLFGFGKRKNPSSQPESHTDRSGSGTGSPGTDIVSLLEEKVGYAIERGHAP